MMMNLVKKELLNNLLSFRFIVSSVIVVLIMIISTVVLMQDYAKKHDAYIQNLKAHYDEANDKDNYLELMFSGIGADRPPVPLQVFYTGVEKNPNRSSMIFPFFKPRFMGELNINPVFPLFPVMDILFVVSIVLSLIAFVFSYDAVCGERERGTLKLLMSYSVPRDKIILAKWIGGYISLAIPYITGAVIATMIVYLNPRISYDGQEWLAYALTVVVSLVFIGVMYSVGIFVSVWSKRGATSISILLFLWVVFVLMIPNAVPFIVDKIKPIDSYSSVMSQIKARTGGTINDLLGETISAFEQATGITVDQIDFSGMTGEDEDDEEEEQEQQQALASSGSGGGSSSGGGGSQPSMPEGLDMASLESMAGEITDSDLRDIQLGGCERWISKKLKSQMGMDLDQAKKMAADFGYDIDVDALLDECESQKDRLIEMKRSGASAADIAAAQGGGTTQPQQKQQQTVQAKKPEPKKSDGKVSVEEFWGEFMSLSDEEKGKFFDDMYSSFITMNKQGSQISKEEEEKYARDVDSQVALTKNISRISPVSAYIYAVTDLANTGIEREKHLKQYLWDYQSKFLDFLVEKFNMPDEKRVHSIFGGAFREPEYNLDNFPRFDYEQMELSQRISYAFTDLAVLFGFAFLFFLLAYFSFIKADIID